jgi:chemotaxis protein methyltransferase CheR
VVVASRSFYQTFSVSRHETQGQKLYDLAGGRWDIAELRHLLEEILPLHTEIDAYEVEQDFPAIGLRTMLLNARRIFSEEGQQLSILLAIEDITERRAAEREKDELLRQKDVLLKEMKHRILNSLQIIASILMLKARTVQSQETRQHLEEAHQRVLSLASVQLHLEPSEHGDKVAIGPNLRNLCQSLAQSMVGTDRSLSVDVHAGGGVVDADDAVSLGLIATELLMNALKHAFPNRQQGQVVIHYEVTESGWMLRVSDNGVGRPPVGTQPERAGLGTTIVEALAQQLRARVTVSSGPEGTAVTISGKA